MKRKASYSPGAPPAKKGKPRGPPPPVIYKNPYLALEAKERKYNDVALTVAASTTSTEVAISTFSAGDTVLLRDGNKVLFKSVDIKCQLTNGALTQSNVVRVVLVCDKLAQAEQCIWGAAAAIQDVFDAATTVARRNILSAERFVVLMDEVVTLNELSGTGGGVAMAYFHRHVKIPPALQLVAWSGNSATIPVKNAYTVMYIGSTAAGATAVGVLGTVRVRWCEK